MTTPTPEETFALADADYDAERFRAALEKLSSLDLENIAPALWARALPLLIRCEALLGEPLDRSLLKARKALPRAVELPEARARLHAEIAYVLTAKRCEALARAEAALCDAAWPESSLGPSVQAWIDLRFDQRDDARKHYQAAFARPVDPWRGHVGLARVAYVTGDFDEVLRELDLAGDQPATRANALRLRSDVAFVRGDFEQRLSLKDAILAATPGGMQRRWDELDRASALFTLGRRDAGIEVFRAVWREDEKDDAGRFARGVLNAVEREGEPSPRVMLKAFPTVTQKRNYCGPASLELVVRSLGVADATQDTIAPVVKGERGSTLLAMTRYLEAQGLETRRFEGDAARLRACIELGLPVIVEEEYSTTSHVAVVMGVDESLGLLFVQDPMTHVTSERLFKTQGVLGSMYRNAAIVAVKKGDTERAARLDAAGVLDLPHVRLVDQTADEEVSNKPEEVIRLCDRAIALCEDYPLAWRERSWALYRTMLRSNTRSNSERFLAALRAARVRYWEQEWPHQLHGAYLLENRRLEEALIEYESALRRDPGDSNNAQYIAECHMDLARPEEATAAFWRALSIDPSHVRATENFAAHALRNGDLDLAAHLSACAVVMSPDNGFNWVTASQIALERKDREAALAHARKAVEVAGEWSHAKMHLAGVLRTSRDAEEREEALGLYRALSQESPGWFEPRRRAAILMEAMGDAEGACALLVEGIEVAQDEPEPLLRTLTEILLEAGQDERAVEIAESVAKGRPTAGLRSVLWDTLKAAGRDARTVELVTAFHATSPDSPWAAAEHAQALVWSDDAQRAQAVEMLRGAVDASPGYVWARRLLVSALAEDAPDEARAIALAAPDEDPWLFFDLAGLACAAGNAGEAREHLAKMRAAKDDLGWPGQEMHHRVLLTDATPAEALDRLIAEDSADLVDVRARLVLASATGRVDEGLRVLEKLPKDDWLTRSILHAAVDSWDEFRAPLEERIELFVADPATSHAARRGAEAVLLGSRAVRGERAPLDAYLATEPNLEHLGGTMTTVAVARHGDLLLDIRRAIGAREPSRATVLLERARLAGALGKHDEAIDHARQCLARWPQSAIATAYLAGELLMAGDFQAAQAAAKGAMRFGNPWVFHVSAAATAALLNGDREGAARLARRGEVLVAAAGYAMTEYTLLKATLAALRGDAAGVERARTEKAAHFDPASVVWPALAKAAG